MSTTTQVRKWGNSLAIRLPAKLAQELNLTANSTIEITSHGSSATIQRHTPAVGSLDDLLNSITPDNLHHETDWGNPVGREVW